MYYDRQIAHVRKQLEATARELRLYERNAKSSVAKVRLARARGKVQDAADDLGAALAAAADPLLVATPLPDPATDLIAEVVQ